MASGESKPPGALGFLTVVDHDQHGLLGGYLVLNAIGRPLEFHCTTPVKPNRAQQILYGRALEPYLYGEQIGATLIAKARVQPTLICTDCRPVLAARPHCATPLALVLPSEKGGPPLEEDGLPSEEETRAEEETRVERAARAEEETPAEEKTAADNPEEAATLRIDIAHSGLESLSPFTLGRNRLAVEAAYREDRDSIMSKLASLTDDFDLLEPFERIRQAIEEAQRGGR